MGIKTDFSKVTDENLFKLCRQYGECARFWRQKFIGLLPEVYKRKLYEKKGFLSIFEFAKKLAGLSEEQVRLTLNLEKRFQDMSTLKSLLVNGDVSINKLTKVASIVDHENQEFLATQVQILSKSALETLVRDEKLAKKNMQIESADFACDVVTAGGGEVQIGLSEPIFEAKSLPGQTLNPLNLSSEVEQKLLELQQKGIDINQLLLEFLRKREYEIVQEKEQIREMVLRNEAEKPSGKSTSHYIPKVVKKILMKEFGTKCSINNCKKLATAIHHTQRFSLSESHDPRYLAPLCKEHHELAHAVDVNYQKFRWRKYS